MRSKIDSSRALMGYLQRGPEPKLIAVLQAIVNGCGDVCLDAFDSATVNWAIQGGLGPLFFRAVKERLDNLGCSHWEDLKAADLTARIIVAKQMETMGEIIDACKKQVPPLTLLKGISIAEQCYPEPHFRLMRDLDFLVDKEFLPVVKAKLEELGYRQRCDGGSAASYEGHHHAAPFFHERKEVWVEVHHALLSFRKRASGATVFQSDSLFSQLRRSEFQGREVRRLSLELQLVYLAAHWAQDFKTVGGLVALVDTIYLLKQVGQGLSWEWIVSAVKGSVAATYLYLMLSYMERNGLVKLAPEILRELFMAQPSFGKINLKAAHAIIDRYYVAGREFGPLLSERNIGIVWKTLTLPGPAARNLLLASLNLSLSSRYRIQ